MNNSNITGNIGEWSEVYVLLRLLADGKLYAAQSDAMPDKNLYFPLTRVFRREKSNKEIEFDLSKEEVVCVSIEGEEETTISPEEFTEKADELYREIEAKGGRTFSVPDVEYFLFDRLGCESIKASNAEKADITIQIHDPQTGYEPICGFSIKSQLGSASTLLNAGPTTNFAFEIEGLSESDISQINSINTQRKIIDRVKAIHERAANVRFSTVVNKTFARNLMLVDSQMPAIMAEALILYYRDGVRPLADIVNVLEEQNPLHYPSSGFYAYKIKKFLCAVALGLKPATEWDGKDEANGGYIIVTTTGEVVAYSIYNRNDFEDYLLANTCLEKGSTTRHEFASLYEKDGRVYINLNLQIRFV